jgi:hypothetical protein
MEYSEFIKARHSPYLLWQRVLVQNDLLFTKAVTLHLDARSLLLHTTCSVGCTHNTKVITVLFTGRHVSLQILFLQCHAQNVIVHLSIMLLMRVDYLWTRKDKWQDCIGLPPPPFLPISGAFDINANYESSVIRVYRTVCIQKHPINRLDPST